jgi:hydrogenase expression/formation protein HypC
MCLSLPARLTEREGDRGRADLDGNAVEVDLSLVPDASPGDYVILHAGYALEIYSEEEARQSLDAIEEALGAD